MSISPLLPLALSTGSTVAREAASRIGAGLSSFAEALAQGSPPETDTPHRRGEAESALAAFYEQAAGALREAGVDLAFPLTLETDVRGLLRIRGAHHQQEEIRQVLAAHPELTSAFHELSEQLRVLAETSGGSQLRIKLSETAADFKFA